MSTLSDLFFSAGEPFAAGLFEAPERSLFYRHCNGYARWFEALPPLPYEKGERLYPGKNRYLEACYTYAVRPQYVKSFEYNEKRMREKSPAAAEVMSAFASEHPWPGGWLHSAVNYPRVVKEGLSGYRSRIESRPSGEDFREGLLLLLRGIESFISRSVEALKAAGAPEELTAALSRVPFAPCETYYEGLVAWNMIFYLDGCDNLGVLDSGLAPLCRGEDLTEVIGELFSNLDATGMWSCTIGHEISPVTYQALRAIKGKRRPMLELMVSDQTPADLWAIAAENLASGCTNPSFYNKKGIRDMLKTRFPQMTEQELSLFCGCGCTETNLMGICRAGGTDPDLNLLLIFSDYLHAHLAEHPTFDSFFEGLCRETEGKTRELLAQIEENYRFMALHRALPMRTLLMDDCIEKGKDFLAGGPRYTWTMNSDSGIINVIDSLAALRKLYYEDGKYSAEEFLRLLDEEDPAFYEDLRTCPCYGVDDDRTDRMGAEYVRRAYTVYQDVPKTDFIDAYTLTEHQFLRYEACGKAVGPTPDGRHDREPTCDSIGALRGKAVKGPTAMLSSCAKLPQHLAEGISVTNVNLNKRIVARPEVLRSLVEGYFALGGIQVQITASSAEELQDALAHPEKHRDLIVRVGGYSDYFTNLSPALRKAVVSRSMFE